MLFLSLLPKKKYYGDSSSESVKPTNLETKRFRIHALIKLKKVKMKISSDSFIMLESVLEFLSHNP